jgi:hypothetical protein
MRKVTHSFESVGAKNLPMHHHIPEEWNKDLSCSTLQKEKTGSFR